MNRRLFTILFALICQFGWAQKAEKVLQKMTLEEKVGQLFMVAAYSNRGEEHVQELERLITQEKIGGLIYFQGGPQRQIQQLNRLQAKADVPLMVSMDAEWGVSMRLDSTIRYPRQMTLGAITDDHLIEQFGAQVAKECKALGIHMNLAPVVDVNNNPNNPVIGNRSFGEDPFIVSQQGKAYIKGMNSEGVMGCFKHFPGHGDTDTDSHLDLPIVPHGMDRLSKIELVPFVQGIKEGVQGIMVAHLYMPKLDATKNRATTLSPKVVTEFLKDSLGYQGLIFTDALNMKGVAKFFKPGEVDKMAFAAGNDVLLFSEDVSLGIQQIVEAVQKGEIPEERVDESCLKILKYKEEYGILDNAFSPEYGDYATTLLGKEARLLKRKLFEHAITLIHNKNQLPMKRSEVKNGLCIVFGSEEKTGFQKTLDLYGRFEHFNVAPTISKSAFQKILNKAKQADKVIVAIQTGSNNPKTNYGFSLKERNMVTLLNKSVPVNLAVFTNPYALLKLGGLANLGSISVAYQNDEVVQDVMAQAFFGVVKFQGELPISLGEGFARGTGAQTKSIFELGHAHPTELHIDEKQLEKVDALIKEVVAKKASPGVRVMASRYGKVFFDKSYGGYTYTLKNKVEAATVYDLASITKVMSSTAIAMQLHEEGKLDLTATLGDYLELPEDSLGYSDVKIIDMMGHQAGFKSWIPFYQRWQDCDTCDIWRGKPDAEYGVEMARNMFCAEAMEDSLYRIMLETPFRENTDYKYSDLGFYWLKAVIEQIEKKPLEVVFQERISEKMGLAFSGYQPLKNGVLSQWIAPTEFDADFRKQLLQGHVHDPGAVFQNGVGGHAGLFATAPEVLLLANAMLYPEKAGLWKKETVSMFTSRMFDSNDNRRGVGFDKPVMEPGPGPAFPGAPATSFGHSGFTGTLFWADPSTGLAMVFLSNRVYPTASNNLLARENYRSKTLQYLFEAMTDWNVDQEGAEGKLTTKAH